MPWQCPLLAYESTQPGLVCFTRVEYAFVRQFTYSVVPLAFHIGRQGDGNRAYWVHVHSVRIRPVIMVIWRALAAVLGNEV